MYKKDTINKGMLKSHTRKLWLIMRLTTVILIATILQVSASGFAQKISLSKTNAPLREIVRDLSRQSGYDFIATDALLKTATNITINVKNTEFSEALKKVFENQPIEYVIADNTVTLKPKEKPSFLDKVVSWYANITVTGRVLNEKGEALSGATVKVKGTERAVRTNVNGAFSISDVDENALLLISYLGYKDREVKAKKDLGNVGMEVFTSELSEVSVSTGYQKIAKERFVGSASTLDSAAYARRAGMGILDRLDGTVTGVLFNKKGQVPLQVRGISTLSEQGTSPDPLIVLDNFPYSGSLSNINPNDILSISVLKDAAAASIWGTRAGNGVIVITTKKGKFNQPIKVTYSSTLTLNERPDLFYVPQISNADYIDFEKNLFLNGYYNSDLLNSGARLVVSPVVEILNKKRNNSISVDEADRQIEELSKLDIRENLNEFLYRRLLQQQHYLNMTGGNNQISYFFSAGLNNSSSVYQGAKGIQQYTLNSGSVLRPLKKLELEVGLNLSRTNDQSPNVVIPNKYAPYAQIADANGAALPIPYRNRQSYVDTAGLGRLLDWSYRPIDEVKNSDYQNITLSTRLDFGATYHVTNWLKANVKYQHVSTQTNSSDNQNLNSWNTRDKINRFTQIKANTVTRIIPLGGILNTFNTRSNTDFLRGQLSANKNWNNEHEFNSFVAMDISNTSSLQNSDTFYGYNDDIGSFASGLNYSMTYPSYDRITNSQRIPDGGALNFGTVNKVISLTSSASYAYKQRYTLYGSARRDGANIFGVNTNNRWKPLWSVGGSWEVSKEKFYNVGWAPYLRIRSSYGYSGNVNNRLSGLTSILYSTTPTEYTNLNEAQIVQAPNPNLRWEQVATANAGFDFGLFKNRLSGSLDFFRKVSTDIIQQIPLDVTTGVRTYTVNSASLKGKGFELNLQSVNFDREFKWETAFGLSYVKTIVTKYNNRSLRTGDFLLNRINPYPGQIAWALYTYKWSGLDPANGDPQGYYQGNVSKDYQSIANDSLQNQKFSGSALPLFSGLLKNTFSYRNISLSTNLTYRFSYNFLKPSVSYSRMANNWISNSDYSKRWQKPGDESHTIVPSFVYPINQFRDSFYANSETNVLKADNIRLQDIRLEYSLNRQIIKNLPVSSVGIFFYANNLNLILWRAQKSIYDPDFTNGTDNPGVPTPAAFSAGLNVQF